MKILLLFFLLLISIFANDELIVEERGVFATTSDINSSIEQSINYSDPDEEVVNSSTNLYERVTLTQENQSKLIYANYVNSPDKIYKNQRFFIDIRCRVVTDEFDKIETRFLNSKNLYIINPDSKWEFDRKNSYKNRFYFKTETKNFEFPDFQILLFLDDKIVDSVELKSLKPSYSDISNSDKLFSNIIAKDLALKSVKTKQYNNKELLTIIELYSKDANLEDFYLSDIEEQGTLSFEENYPNQSMFYYFITPIFQKELIFRYFDIYDNGFKLLNIPIVLNEELVSTQTDLNPNASNLLFYKRVVLGIISLLFIIILIFRRKVIYLIFAVILLSYFTSLMLPNKIIELKKGSEIRIVPTSNSSIFYVLQSNSKVELLDTKDDYIKVLFKNKLTNSENIGWVKESYIAKD